VRNEILLDLYSINCEILGTIFCMSVRGNKLSHLKPKVKFNAIGVIYMKQYILSVVSLSINLICMCFRRKSHTTLKSIDQQETFFGINNFVYISVDYT